MSRVPIPEPNLDSARARAKSDQLKILELLAKLRLRDQVGFELNFINCELLIEILEVLSKY